MILAAHRLAAVATSRSYRRQTVEVAKSLILAAHRLAAVATSPVATVARR
ncbi:MAG: hypothetical protein R3C56_20565 [Pirellulaceae bacterium]